MKRQRRKINETNKRIKIVLQVSKNKKLGYRSIWIGSEHVVLELIPPPEGSKYGEWIHGDGRPVFIYSHELRYIKPLKVVRKRLKKIKKIKRKRRY